jgi:hypothetical protein
MKELEHRHDPEWVIFRVEAKTLGPGESVMHGGSPDEGYIEEKLETVVRDWKKITYQIERMLTPDAERSLRPDEVEVLLGFSAKAGLHFLVHGEGKAEMTFKVTWRRSAKEG